jgi:hypothetical protein
MPRARRPEPRASVLRGGRGWDDEADLDEYLDDQPSGLRRAARLLGVAGGSAAVVGALAIGLFPTSTFLDQRAATAEAQERLSVLQAQNEAFEERIDRLSSDEEIERLAREQYNLAYPGEEAYAVLPAPLPPLDLPEVWPFGPLLDPADATETGPVP